MSILYIFSLIQTINDYPHEHAWKVLCTKLYSDFTTIPEYFTQRTTKPLLFYIIPSMIWTNHPSLYDVPSDLSKYSTKNKRSTSSFLARVWVLLCSHCTVNIESNLVNFLCAKSSRCCAYMNPVYTQLRTTVSL